MTDIIRKEKEETLLIKRFDEKNIQITIKQRNLILEALNRGDRFIQVGKYTLMINAIKSIDPEFPNRKSDDEVTDPFVRKTLGLKPLKQIK